MRFHGGSAGGVRRPHRGVGLLVALHARPEEDAAALVAERRVELDDRAVVGRDALARGRRLHALLGAAVHERGALDRGRLVGGGVGGAQLPRQLQVNGLLVEHVVVIVIELELGDFRILAEQALRRSGRFSHARRRALDHQAFGAAALGGGGRRGYIDRSGRLPPDAGDRRRRETLGGSNIAGRTDRHGDRAGHRVGWRGPFHRGGNGGGPAWWGSLCHGDRGSFR